MCSYLCTSLSNIMALSGGGWFVSHVVHGPSAPDFRQFLEPTGQPMLMMVSDDLVLSMVDHKCTNVFILVPSYRIVL